jgi:MerR family transcriptional regulator/heat shock protein HspR
VDTAAELYEPNPAALYTLEEVVRLTHLPRRQIVRYCQCGLVAPVAAPEAGGWTFNDEGLRRLRRLDALRQSYDVNLPALRLIMELMDEVERLRQELRFLRAF